MPFPAEFCLVAGVSIWWARALLSMIRESLDDLL